MRVAVVFGSIAIAWICGGLLAAGWFNGLLRHDYCRNYLDPDWAAHNFPNFPIRFGAFGPIALGLALAHGDYRHGWTLSFEPTTSEQCRRFAEATQ